MEPHLGTSISSHIQEHDVFDQQVIASNCNTQHVSVDSGARDYYGVIARDLLHLLPEKRDCERLVQVFFDRVEWIHHIVYRPSFDVWYRSITQGAQDSGEFCRSDCMWFALLYVMLCLALYFGVSLTVDLHRTAEDFFRLSCKALEASEYLDHPSAISIQVLVMQGLWLNDHRKSNRHHHNLAIAIRMANLLGMGQLDARNGVRCTQGESAEKELHRRIFWSLVCQDYYMASSCNFTYLIPPMQIATNLPQDVDDDDTGCRTSGVPTAMSYHIAKIPFAQSVRRYVDLCHSGQGISYEEVLSLEQETRRLYAELPPYLQHGLATPSTSLQWQALFMEITLHNRIMRLHRSFMARGYNDMKYRHSTRVTLASAKRLLDLVSQGKQGNFPGLRWWVIRIHVFSAGVACCVALFHERLQHAGMNITAHPLIRHIEQAFSLLSEALECSNAAQNARETLHVLYNHALTLVPTREVEYMDARRTAPSDEQWQANPEPMSMIDVDWNALLLPDTLRPQDLDGAIKDTIIEFASTGH